MVERKYDFNPLSFEKLLSQLAIETPMVKSSKHNHKNGDESSELRLANRCKTSNAVALQSNTVSLLCTSLLNLSISTAKSVLFPLLKQ